MPRRAKWPWQSYAGPDDYCIRELLRAVMDLNTYYGDKDHWLWRGQPDADYVLNPAIHTRIEHNGYPMDVDEVVKATEGLLSAARIANVNVHEGTALPDMALLAMLQHHRAATPLMDVSLDPLVALYMAVVSDVPEHGKCDGVLFAIKRPAETAAAPFDSRTFDSIYRTLDSDKAYLYSAPEVSDRLRIQRGHFLLGQVNTADKRIQIPLTVEADDINVDDTWLARRLAQRGRQGAPVVASTDVGVFRIPAKFKPALKKWLEERTDLTYDYVYPTAWHQPHLEEFCTSHNRKAPL